MIPNTTGLTAAGATTQAPNEAPPVPPVGLQTPPENTPSIGTNTQDLAAGTTDLTVPLGQASTMQSPTNHPSRKHLTPEYRHEN